MINSSYRHLCSPFQKNFARNESKWFVQGTILMASVATLQFRHFIGLHLIARVHTHPQPQSENNCPVFKTIKLLSYNCLTWKPCCYVENNFNVSHQKSAVAEFIESRPEHRMEDIFKNNRTILIVLHNSFVRW